MGFDIDIIKNMSSGKESGKSEKHMLDTLRQFINRVRSNGRNIVIEDYNDELGWINSKKFSIPSFSQSDPEFLISTLRAQWNGWNKSEKKKVKLWLKDNIPKGLHYHIRYSGSLGNCRKNRRKR
jgi:hypothetical protein